MSERPSGASEERQTARGRLASRPGGDAATRGGAAAAEDLLGQLEGLVVGQTGGEPCKSALAQALEGIAFAAPGKDEFGQGAQRKGRRSHEAEDGKRQGSRGGPGVAGSRSETIQEARLIGAGGQAAFEFGEAGELETLDPESRAAWVALLASCQELGRGKPTVTWRKQVEKLVPGIGRDELKRMLLRWFPLVDDVVKPQHVELLKGLVYLVGEEADRELARALVALSLNCYRKVPGRGPRQVSLGNAAIWALGTMPGRGAVGQLAILKLKLKHVLAQKEVEKALAAVAKREGLPFEEIEELAVPSYGMEDVGHRREELGGYRAELVVEGSSAKLRWSRVADGKALKSVPAALKKEHAEGFKELQSSVKDSGKMLTAQRERIEKLFLARRSWPVEAWRQRYFDHPLVGTIARRLIW